MSRVLYIASRFPHPPFRGDIVRTLQQIRRLGSRFEITLVAPAPPNGVTLLDAGLQGKCDHIPVHCSAWDRILNLGPFLKDRLPIQTVVFYSKAYGEAVARALGEQDFDLVHLQMVRVAPVLNHVKQIPVVLDMIDTASLNMERRARREAPVLRGAVEWEAQRLRTYERVLVSRSARVVVCSPADLEALPKVKWGRVVPFGIDLRARPFRDADRESAEIVFTGRMLYCLYFTTEAVP